MADPRMVPMLTAAQIKRVDEAIGEAEKNTKGEIIAVLAGRSRIYWHAPYEAGLLGAGLAILLATLGSLLLTALKVFQHGGVEAHGGWPTWHVGWYCAISVTGFLGGFFLARFPRVERCFAGAHIMRAECEERARRLFAQYGVFGTTGHTGVLLYVSLFERMVIVLGDTAISAKLGKTEYEEVVEVVIKKIAAGKLQEGLIDGIQLLGVHLAAHFPKAPGDADELPNRLYVVA
jgi:putative membrane protein